MQNSARSHDQHYFFPDKAFKLFSNYLFI